MRILMFGRGPVATIYGWALQQAGHEIEFYVRPGRAATYGEAIDIDLLDARASCLGPPRCLAVAGVVSRGARAGA